mgnify:FL=1
MRKNIDFSLNVAICDDLPVICKELERLVDMAFSSMNFTYSYLSFSSGNSLLHHLKQKVHSFQIYLLDIEMDGIDGLETAEKIREQD